MGGGGGGGHLKGARKVCGGHYELPKKKGFHNVLLLTLHAEMHTPIAACILNGGPSQRCKKGVWRALWIAQNNVKFIMPSSPFMLKWGGASQRCKKGVWRALWIAQKEGFSQCPPPHLSCRDAHSHCCMHLKWGATSKVQERCVEGTMNCPKRRVFTMSSSPFMQRCTLPLLHAS